jgi:hypothetical protein
LAIDLATTDDWTEIQESDCWGKCLIVQYGETTCCQRRSGRVDNEGSDLLLSSERGAGGVVLVSKEEVALGRKGGGGAWGSTSRNAGLAGPAPQNGRIRTLAKQQPSCRSSGCRLQVGGAENDLLAIRLQSSKTLFSAARPYEQFKVLGVLV